jgi:hypothetical protein
VRVYALPTGETVGWCRGHSAPCNGVAFSPDGTQLATVSDDGTARVWGVRGHQVWSRPLCLCSVRCAAAGWPATGLVPHTRTPRGAAHMPSSGCASAWPMPCRRRAAAVAEASSSACPRRCTSCRTSPLASSPRAAAALVATGGRAALATRTASRASRRRRAGSPWRGPPTATTSPRARAMVSRARRKGGAWSRSGVHGSGMRAAWLTDDCAPHAPGGPGIKVWGARFGGRSYQTHRMIGDIEKVAFGEAYAPPPKPASARPASAKPAAAAEEVRLRASGPGALCT